MAAGISVALFLVVAVLGPLALMLFGPLYGRRGWPLAVLRLAPLRPLGVRTGRAGAVDPRPAIRGLPAVGLGMAVLVVANFLLVPPLGLLGAAIAALIAQTVWSAALWLTALSARLDVSLCPRSPNS